MFLVLKMCRFAGGYQRSEKHIVSMFRVEVAMLRNGVRMNRLIRIEED